jgi:RNA polymerase sigma factor (sigma-70 family)
MTKLDQEAAYLRLRRLLFGALARLARQGFTAPPADALDLIQDFFAEVWPAVSANFDPARGTKLETYVYQAFVHFARPRIAELHRWRNLLVDTVELARISDRLPVAEASESERDLGAVADAIRALPPLHRDVLTAYLASGRPSERAIAEKFSLSRYRLRQTLAEAFARVAIALGERGRISERDWLVARALWEERRTPAEAAGHLGMTSQQIRNARERIGTILVRQLRALPPELASH